MKFMKKLINKMLCFTVLVNICCSLANAVNKIDVCDYRFVSNAGIIEYIQDSVNFQDTCFQSLWKTGRKGESSEHLALDAEHMIYTVQLSPTLTVDEIYISAPIINSASDNKMVGTILISAQYSKPAVLLSDAIKDFCSIETLPQDLDLVGEEDIQYFLNAPDAPVELPVEYEKIESLSEFEMKKDDLEAVKIVVADRDKKTLGTGLSNIGKISLVNVLKADE